MKLRNKKTGEIVDDGYVRETHDFQFDGQKHILAVFKGNGHKPPERVSGAYKSLAELIEEWEDYKPVEPLIKDEKIRKAVRAWAEACAIEKCHYDGDGDFATRWHGIKLDGSEMELDEGHYTIAELCGEEEE